MPGGKPVAIALASLGLLSTSLTIFLSVFPAEDEPHKAMAVVKVVGGTAVMIGIGAGAVADCALQGAQTRYAQSAAAYLRSCTARARWIPSLPCRR